MQRIKLIPPAKAYEKQVMEYRIEMFHSGSLIQPDSANPA